MAVVAIVVVVMVDWIWSVSIDVILIARILQSSRARCRSPSSTLSTPFNNRVCTHIHSLTLMTRQGLGASVSGDELCAVLMCSVALWSCFVTTMPTRATREEEESESDDGTEVSTICANATRCAPFRILYIDHIYVKPAYKLPTREHASTGGGDRRTRQRGSG